MSASPRQAPVVAAGPGVLSAIGNTPLVELRRVVPRGHGREPVKLERAAPTI